MSDNPNKLAWAGTPGTWKVVRARHAIPRGEGMRYSVFGEVKQMDKREWDDRFLFNQKLSCVDDIELHQEAEANAYMISAAKDAVECLADILAWDAEERKTVENLEDLYFMPQELIERIEAILKKAYNF